MTMKNQVPYVILFILILNFSARKVDCQNVIRFESISFQDRNTSAYQKHLSTYSLGSVDKAQVASLLQSQPAFDSLVIEANGQSFPISLQAKDVRADHYVLRMQTASGIETLPRSPNKTY